MQLGMLAHAYNLAFVSLRQEDHKFKASRSYIGRPHLREEKKKFPHIIIKLQVQVHEIFLDPIDKTAFF